MGRRFTGATLSGEIPLRQRVKAAINSADRLRNSAFCPVGKSPERWTKAVIPEKKSAARRI